MGHASHEGHSRTISGVSSQYVESGRRQQKLRTRQALVDAARRLVADGVSPTVEQAAEAAGISRTTAYRYFTNQQSLLAAAHPETAASSLLPADAPDDADERLDIVVRAFLDVIEKSEAQQRTMLRLSLSNGPGGRDLPLRQGRAIPWLTEALQPLDGDLTPDEIHRLALAIRSAIGIESRVWLTDVGGLSAAETTALQRWTAHALLAAATQSPPPVPRRRPGRPTRT